MAIAIVFLIPILIWSYLASLPNRLSNESLNTSISLENSRLKSPHSDSLSVLKSSIFFSMSLFCDQVLRFWRGNQPWLRIYRQRCAPGTRPCFVGRNTLCIFGAVFDHFQAVSCIGFVEVFVGADDVFFGIFHLLGGCHSFAKQNRRGREQTSIWEGAFSF